MQGNAVEGPVDCFCRDEVVQALNEMKALGQSEVSLELILLFEK